MFCVPVSTKKKRSTKNRSQKQTSFVANTSKSRVKRRPQRVSKDRQIKPQPRSDIDAQECNIFHNNVIIEEKLTLDISSIPELEKDLKEYLDIASGRIYGDQETVA